MIRAGVWYRCVDCCEGCRATPSTWARVDGGLFVVEVAPRRLFFISFSMRRLCSMYHIFRPASSSERGEDDDDDDGGGLGLTNEVPSLLHLLLPLLPNSVGRASPPP